jgi:hypothetical protein
MTMKNQSICYMAEGGEATIQAFGLEKRAMTAFEAIKRMRAEAAAAGHHVLPSRKYDGISGIGGQAAGRLPAGLQRSLQPTYAEPAETDYDTETAHVRYNEPIAMRDPPAPKPVVFEGGIRYV